MHFNFIGINERNHSQEEEDAFNAGYDEVIKEVLTIVDEELASAKRAEKAKHYGASNAVERIERIKARIQAASQ